MNKEFNGFDDMVEALEENEDMVECKECFDLVPKIDCEKAEIGYICPTCRGLRTAPAQARFVDPYDSYTQDFPEVTEYDPDSVIEYEKEPGLGDALADLIKDEYEAIEGYEVADETIQHANIDEDEKDEILDTLDHIKEEEEEHIDELKELCPECDPVEEPEAEPAELKEAADDEVTDEVDEVEEIPEEDIPEEAEEESEEDIPEEEAEDSEENENEEVSDLDSAYEAALEIANESGVGQVFGYARKDTEEFVAIEPFEVDDPEAVEDDLMAVYDDVAYAYVAYPERSLEESLFESVQLNEGPGRFLKGIGQRIGNAAQHIVNKDAGKIIDNFFNKGYTVVFAKKEDGAYPPEHKSTYDTVDKALTAGLHLSKEYPNNQVFVLAVPIDTTGLTPREKKVAGISNGFGATIAIFSNGKASTRNDAKLADEIKAINIDKKDLQKTIGKTAGAPAGDPRDLLKDDESEDKKEPVDKDPNLDDEEEATDPKEAAKKMLGEKKAADGYTPESYKKYEAAYAKILAWIEAHPKPAALTQERIDNLKNQAEAKLKEVEDADPDLNDDEEEVTGDNSQSLDEAKAKAKETLGEKKAADAYTEESYATYSANYDKILAAIEGAESVEALEALNIAENKTKNEELLVEKTTEEEPSGTDVDSEEEEVDTEIGTEDEESTGGDKISEISDDRLIKLYQVLSGKQISSNAGVAKSQLKRLRQKLASLGESIGNNSSDEELLEVLQSEAEAVKSLKDTAASLKDTAGSLKNMTSAMKESILNLSPADFAECVDSSRVELWGLEEPEDGVAQAVLIKSYDDVSSEDEQSCHDEMLDLGGMFTFSFTASGKPSLYGWNVEQLRELNQAGLKGISFDDPAYEEAISLAWRLK